MGIKNVFKWRVTSTKYLYLTDEENKNPFILDKKTGDRIYPLPVSGSTVTGITVVTGMTLDEGLISQTVAQIKNETDYSRKYNRMVELAAYDENASGLTFLDYTKYFNLDGDECIEEAVAPKCEGYEPVFNVSAYTLENGTDVKYSFYADKNESDKTLRYNLKLGIPRGEKGEKGNDGAGCKGEPGDPGLPAIFDDITARIESLEPDEQPTINLFSASTTANTYQLQFDFGVPRGEAGEPGVEGPQGDDGIPARLGSVDIESETLAPGEEAYVQIKDGTYEVNRVYDSYEGREFYNTTFTLQFGLPQGIQGLQGIPGENAEIREVTAKVIETLEPGYWYPSESDPNRTWIKNDAEAGVDVNPVGGGNVVDLHFWFKIPRGDKGDPGKDGEPGGGGGWMYNFMDPQFIPTPGLEEPIGDFDVHYYPLLGKADVILQIYYPEDWGGGGKKCRGYVWTEFTSEGGYMRLINSFAEGDIETAEGTNNQPIATGYRSHAEGKRTKAIGQASHAEGIGIVPEQPELENIIGGLKNDCHNDNIIVMPKQQFVDADVDWDDLYDEFFIGATFSIPSDIPINANALPSGVTEAQFRNSILTITSCDLNSYNAENNYFSLDNVSVSFDVDGQTYQIDSRTFESNSNGILQTVGGESGVGINEYVDWNNPITIHINNVGPISIPNAIGVASHTEGNGCQTNGDYSHAEGNETRTVGVASHAEGAYTKANGNYSHAGGFGTIAEGTASYAGGYNNREDDDSTIMASGNGSHAEGYASGGTIQTGGDGAYARGYTEGSGSTIQAIGDGSHAEGYIVRGSNVTAHGTNSLAFGSIWDENSQILSSGDTSVAIGNIAGNNSSIEASGNGACAIGSVEGSGGTIEASGNGACAIGSVEGSGGTIEASNNGSHAEGYANGGTIQTGGDGSHAEGYANGGTIQTGGDGACAIGSVEGSGSTIQASSNGAHASGYARNGGTIEATDYGAHAEGYAEGSGSIIQTGGNGAYARGYAEGSGSIIQASSNSAHASGYAHGYTDDVAIINAGGVGSHAEGYANGGTIQTGGDGAYASGCAEGSGSIIQASSNGAHASGYARNGGIIEATDYSSFASGYAYNDDNYSGNTSAIQASSEASHASGYARNGSIIHADNAGSHAEGYAGGNSTIQASSSGSHAEGYASSGGTIEASSSGSHAEGYAYSGGTIEATDYGAHAEGCSTENGKIKANNKGAHAEGYASSGGTIEASGNGAHAEGCNTIASGFASHAEGIGYPGERHDVNNCVLSSWKIFGLGSNCDSNIFIDEKFEKEEIYIIGSKFEYDGTIYTVTSANSNYQQENTHTIFTNVNVKAEGGNEIDISVLLGGEDNRRDGIVLSGVTMAEKENAIGAASHTENNLTVAEGDYSHAEGNETRAFGVGSHAEGCFSEATGDYSHAAGLGTVANNDHMTAIGKFNQYTGLTPDVLFVIGNGTDNENRSNVLLVDGNTRKITLSQGGGIKLPSGGSSTLVWNTTGGTTEISGTTYSSSDIRKKDILEEISIDKAYELVNKCQTIFYTWKDDETKKKEIGLIAQEVQQYFPELVSEDKDGYLTLDYSKLTVILLVVIRDLTQKVSKIDKLEEKINQLEEKIQ